MTLDFWLVLASIILCCDGSSFLRNLSFNESDSFNGTENLTWSAFCKASLVDSPSLMNDTDEGASPPRSSSNIPRSERSRLSSFRLFPPTPHLYPTIESWAPDIILHFISKIIEDYDGRWTDAQLWTPVPGDVYAFDDQDANLRFWMRRYSGAHRPLCWYDVDMAVEKYVEEICEVRKREIHSRWAETFFEYKVGQGEDLVLALGGLARDMVYEEPGATIRINGTQGTHFTEI